MAYQFGTRRLQTNPLKELLKEKGTFWRPRFFAVFGGRSIRPGWGKSAPQISSGSLASVPQICESTQPPTPKDGKLISHLLGWLVGAQFDPPKPKMSPKVAHPAYTRASAAPIRRIEGA